MKTRNLLGLLGVLAALSAAAPSAGAAAPDPSVFPARTGAVLAFDDGIDGVTLVDLDRSRAVRRVLDGQRAGDQPYRLLRAADTLVVGWSDVHAAPLTGGRSRALGPSTIALPATEKGAVWLVDSGTRLGDRPAAYRLVDARGTVLLDAGRADAPELAGAFATAGVPAGLAFESGAGVRIWYPADGHVSTLGSAPSFVGDVRGDLVSWCEDPCTRLHLTHLRGGDRTIGAPGARSFDVHSGAISPNGHWIAVPTHGTGSVSLIDTRTGEHTTIADDFATEGVHLGWAGDSRTLYASSWSHQEPRTEVAAIDPRSRRVRRAVLPFGGLLGFVVLERADARALLRAPDTSSSSCAAPSVYPSGRTEPCGFRFRPARSAPRTSG